MAEILKIPRFETEGEEARWWAENQDQLAQVFQRAASEGNLRRGTVARRGNTPTTTVKGGVKVDQWGGAKGSQ
jgi:hypothetical protein